MRSERHFLDRSVLVSQLNSKQTQLNRNEGTTKCKESLLCEKEEERRAESYERNCVILVAAATLSLLNEGNFSEINSLLQK
jgi:hypothetical protein